MTNAANPAFNDQPAADVLLTASEAAEILGIGRSKLYELMARGSIRSVKVDRCRRFCRSDIDRFIRGLGAATAT